VRAGFCPRLPTYKRRTHRLQSMGASLRRQSATMRSLMMVKGFEVWKVAVRLLPKRFDTTKTRSRPSPVKIMKHHDHTGLAEAQERPSPDPCRLYSTLFNNLDAGVANPESCMTIKVASSTFQESPPVQSIRLQERACCLRCPQRQRPDRGLAPLLCRQDDHLRLDRRS
jgi:hypothetical protein